MDFENIEYDLDRRARIQVVGVGGGGGNAVQHMIDSGLRGVSFICANTHVQALDRNTAACKIQLGEHLTKGLGAGANPSIGRAAALESVAAIKECLADADMVFVTAGMGGGTGTGAAPIIAQTAKELGALTVGVVTKPFSFEGANRKAVAESGIAEFRRHVDCLITIPNDRLLTFALKIATFSEMLKEANEILYYGVKGISDIITQESFIGLDFADVRTCLCDSGLARMGMGIASGKNRAREAAMQAITSPLLEDASICDAKTMLYNINASRDITHDEIQEISTIIADAAHPEALVIMGLSFDDNVGDALRVTLIATGIESVNGKIPDNIALAVITMSPPEEMEAYYMCVAMPFGRDVQIANIGYFTLEKSRGLPGRDKETPSLPMFIGSWDINGNHANYGAGPSPETPDAFVERVLSLVQDSPCDASDNQHSDEEFETPAFIRRLGAI